MKDSSKKMFKGIFKKGDLLLVAVLLVAVILTVVFATRKNKSLVSVYVDGTLQYELDINADTELLLLDGDVKVVIRGGEAWFESSSCPEQLCVHSSHISHRGGMIVCLPNRVVVKIISTEVDAIT